MKPGTLRRIALNEWRGYFEPRKKANRLTPIQETVDQVMKQWGLTARIQEREITAAWREIVGDFLAIHSQPVCLRQGVLHVQVLQPTILYELDRHLKPHVLEKLYNHFGQGIVKEVRFKIC